MNAKLQLATFDVALEAFNLLYHLEFALRHTSAGDPTFNLGRWQRWPTLLEDKIQRLAAQVDSQSFKEQAEAAALSLRECRMALVEFFEPNDWHESELSELRQVNDSVNGTDADWDASERTIYTRFLVQKATEILQPFWPRLEVLEASLPGELRPFFEFCRLTWSLPNDLDEWCVQNFADRRQRHDQLLNVIRPDLQSHLQQCVSCQPGLSIVELCPLVLDHLEYELRELRLAVRQILVDLSSQAVEVGSVSGAVEGAPSGSGDGASSTTAEAGVGSGLGEVVGSPTGSGNGATTTTAEAGADTGQQQTEEKQEETDVGDDPLPIVPVGRDKKVPFIDNKVGVIIYGIQVKIKYDAKNLLIYFCNSTSLMDYAALMKHLNDRRNDPTKKSTVSTKQLSEGAARRIMTNARNSLRAAFDDPSGEPIKSDEYEPHHRFTLDREWLATQFEKINRNTPQSD